MNIGAIMIVVTRAMKQNNQVTQENEKLIPIFG